MEPAPSTWHSAAHALDYLARADRIPHRTEGEAMVLELVPPDAGRILDLGTGDGRLLALLKCDRPEMQAIAVDFSETMLAAVGDRFGADPTVDIVAHDFRDPLPSDWGEFDAIVSSFAIHHVADGRKRSLYGEIFERLRPGGIFCNLEHVSSPTPTLHRAFLRAIGYPEDFCDPANQLLDAHTQVQWLRAIGFEDADCYWKWRELALLAGRKPA